MSLNYVSEGKTIAITGQASNVSSGSLYALGNTHAEAFWGIVQDDIIGTAAALTTIDGRPILDEDVTQLGDGKGDMQIEGVFEMVVASGYALTAQFAVGDAVYASGFNTVAGPSNARHGAYDVKTYGVAQQLLAYTGYGVGAGLSLVGHVWRAPYLDLRTASPFKGSWIIETKLLGHPQVGLV